MALAGTVRVRGALFALEVREELRRRERMVVLAVVAATFLHLALLLVSGLVAAAFWDTDRRVAIGVMVALYGAVGLAAALKLRAALSANPDPFAATRRELERDFAPGEPVP